MRRVDNRQNVVMFFVGVNVFVFLLQLISINFFNFPLQALLALNPLRVIHQHWLWQPVTYMFLHDTSNIFHIIFNMFFLWMFGSPVEYELGRKKFISFFLFSGIGAGLGILLINYFVAPYSYTLGASGVVFAMLLAYGFIYPDQVVLLLVFPVKARYLVVIYAAFDLIFMVLFPGDNISYVGHFSGLFFGFLYFLLFQRYYLFPNKPAQQAQDIIQEIRKKVDEIKDKAIQQNIDIIKNRVMAIQDKIRSGKVTWKNLSKDDQAFLASLIKSVPQEKWHNICESIDFDIEDDYCNHCEYFSVCLYRDTTGEDVKRK